jgi:hypothetical protein
MNALLVVLLLLAQADDSPLVKAAKAAGGPHKPSTKVITNDDVKKGAAKSGGGQAPPPVNAAADPKSPLQKLDEQRKSRVALAKRLDDAEKKVAQLEAEMRRVEQAYYEESDLNRRDTVLVLRFEQTKKQLDVAKKELADARESVAKKE